jgi:hypothetical protein
MNKPFAISLQRNAFACGECGVFANSLKRIGKWKSLAFAKLECICHFASEMHSPVAKASLRHLPFASQRPFQTGNIDFYEP